jgi:hypothetical protein
MRAPRRGSRRHRPRQFEERDDVDLGHPPEVVRRQIGKGADVEDAGIVDERVDGPSLVGESEQCGAVARQVDAAALGELPRHWREFQRRSLRPVRHGCRRRGRKTRLPQASKRSPCRSAGGSRDDRLHGCKLLGMGGAQGPARRRRVSSGHRSPRRPCRRDAAQDRGHGVGIGAVDALESFFHFASSSGRP